MILHHLHQKSISLDKCIITIEYYVLLILLIFQNNNNNNNNVNHNIFNLEKII